MKCRLAFLALATLLVAGACGSDEPDTQVLGEQVTAADEGGTAGDDVGPLPPPVPDEPATTSTSSTSTTTTAPAVPPPGPEALELTLALERTEVPAGSEIVGLLSARNPTGSTIDISHSDSCETVQGLYQGGQLVSESPVCAQVIAPDSMPPGQTRTWSVRIRTGGLAPGAYEARAGINLATDAFAPAVPVTIAAA